MSIGVQTPGVHHVALRSRDLERSRRFYAQTLGFPVALELPNLFIFLAGSTAIAVRGPEEGTPEDDRFSPFRVGLDHVALACGREQELERVAAALARADVPNTGTKLDEVLGKRYVAFKDPDYVAVRFDLDTTYGVIPAFDCFRVSNGLIQEVRPFYDPRPITNAAA